MLRLLPLFLLVGLGVVGVIIFGYFTLIDWDALVKAYANFSALARNSSNLGTLFAAEAEQNIHRINVFAEGVWTLQSAIIAAIGLHGICTLRRSR